MSRWLSWFRKQRRPAIPDRPKLHVGCGRERLEGWVNIDIEPLPAVDVVADASSELDFTGCEAVYAEHFLEHLRLDRAVSFLRQAYKALESGGLVRLSTPNLDWVWQTHYNAQAFPEVKQEMAIQVNLAFRGWEHQFLWNREFLGEVLEACGFVDVTWCQYRESQHEVFRGVERHPTSDDTEEQPHVLIVEARKGEEQPERLEALRWRIEKGFLQHMSAV